MAHSAAQLRVNLMQRIRARATIVRLLAGVAALCVGLLWPTLILARGPAQAADQPVVTQTIRYHTREAGEVALLWGVNGWAQLPQAQRPAGTVIEKNAMATPMTLSDDGFVVSVQVPRGATIDYLFHITRAPSGVAADAWEGNGAPNLDFHAVAQDDGVVDVRGMASLADQTFSSTSDITLQWYGILALLGVGLLIILSLVFRSRDPYLN